MTIPFIFGSARAQERPPQPVIVDEVVDRGLEAGRIPDTLLRRDPRIDLFHLGVCQGNAGEVDIRARLRRCR